MAPRRTAEIDRLLDEAQGKGACLSVHDRALRAALERRVGHGLVSPRPSLYARKAYWEGLPRRQRELHILRGQAGRHPNWTFCFASAALLHGLPISFGRLKKCHVLGTGTAHSSLARRHYVRRRGVVLDGVRVTSFEDTIVDCLLTLGFDEGLVIADAALARLGVTRERLAELVLRLGKGRSGLDDALACVAWADARSESGGESMGRAVMIRHGFMLPELQVVVGNANCEGESWRCDYLWHLADGTTVAGELDGHEKYVNPEMTKGRDAVAVMSNERMRESQLTLYVDRIMRFSYADIVNEERLVAKLEKFGIPRVSQGG